ncbi:bacillithiol system redox-active protein YtxJ [Bacillus coahuilensis]|uniref:bacillithiol system redox-active protein YtxJ n=1 Tax=Bacillus coahuilensis TaxID=408580 RepID=UPI00018511A9|nr:bacillithiol system redox-active protein YtxJ [Bacillus coahuilensis]
MKKIHSINDFESLLQSEDRFFFLKHSLTCPISGKAFDEYSSFINSSAENGYYLAVQDSRELSGYIAKKFAIRHESPQAFLFIDGKPSWNVSHFKITEKALKAL